MCPLNTSTTGPGEDGQREAFSNEKARARAGARANGCPSREAVRLTADWVRTLSPDRARGSEAGLSPATRPGRPGNRAS